MGGTRSTSAAPPAINSSTFPRQHRLKNLSIFQHDIQLTEIKYCENTRPQNQLSAAQEQQECLCTIFQGAFVTVHTILLGVGGTFKNQYTPEPFQELGLDSQRAEKLALNLHNILSTTLSKSSIPGALSVLLPTLIGSRFQVKPAILLIPVDLILFCVVEEFYHTQYQSGSFFFINMGVKFQCLRSFLVSKCQCMAKTIYRKEAAAPDRTPGYKFDPALTAQSVLTKTSWVCNRCKAHFPANDEPKIFGNKTKCIHTNQTQYMTIPKQGLCEHFL